MEVDTVLVAVDGSEEGSRAVEAAVAVAERYDAGVHAVYILGEPEPDRETQLMDDADGLGEAVEITHSTVTGFSTESLRHHPGSALLDAADEVGADLIAVPRERPAEVLGKTAEYVVQYASQPVLSV